jgi:uncharacterized protein
MNPDERQMISGLFDRMRGFGQPQKDRDADTLISQSMRANPDAAYMMVQSLLVQENVMESQAARMAELEAQVRDLEDRMARMQPAAQPASGGFLGGLFGGGAKPASVPTAGRPQPAFMPQGGAAPQRSPWGNTQPQAGGYQQPQQGYGQAPMQQAAPAAGGGFMKQAMATAAGVAGGMLVANSISSMMGGGQGHGSAQAAGTAGATPAAAPGGYDNNDPGYATPQQPDGNDPGYAQPEPQQIDNNDPGYDSGSSGGDWSGEDL